jgi:arginine/lysine/ornithine decarboxylase
VVQRSAHSSVVDGVILAGLEPEFIVPSIDAELGINHGIAADQLAEMLAAVPQAKAVWLVSPSYFGAVADIAGIAQVAHHHGLPLVVDAAWGSHFGFHAELPDNPLRLGADLVISSTHKAAGSLTQSAMLHLGTGPFATPLAALVERALPLTASTSVSMPLLASLDLARAAMVTGQQRIADTMAVTEHLRDQLRAHPLLDVVSDGFGAFADIVAHDPLRVSIDVSRLGISGVVVRERLATEYGIYLEIATHRAVVAFFGPGYTPDTQRLVDALEAIAAPHAANNSSLPTLSAAGPRRVSPRTAFFAATELVPWSQAVGRVASDALSAYPPGIPNVLPGEQLTAEVIEFLQTTMSIPGGYVRGAVDASVVRVMRD